MRGASDRLAGSPKTRIAPSSGARMSMIIRIVVVLPAPLGPRRPKIPPWGISSERFRTAVWPANRLVTPTSWTRVMIGGVEGGTLERPAPRRGAARTLTPSSLGGFREPFDGGNFLDRHHHQALLHLDPEPALTLEPGLAVERCRRGGVHARVAKHYPAVVPFVVAPHPGAARPAPHHDRDPVQFLMPGMKDVAAHGAVRPARRRSDRT